MNPRPNSALWSKGRTVSASTSVHDGLATGLSPEGWGPRASLGFLILVGRLPAASALASVRIICSAAQLPAAAARSPGPGKLASVVTITNSIVLSRAPANKVIHYGLLRAAVGCAAISGPLAAPSRAETRARAITCRRRGRHAVPRGPASRAGGGSAGLRLVLSRNVN